MHALLFGIAIHYGMGTILLLRHSQLVCSNVGDTLKWVLLHNVCKCVTLQRKEFTIFFGYELMLFIRTLYMCRIRLVQSIAFAAGFGLSKCYADYNINSFRLL